MGVFSRAHAPRACNARARSLRRSHRRNRLSRRISTRTHCGSTSPSLACKGPRRSFRPTAVHSPFLGRALVRSFVYLTPLRDSHSLHVRRLCQESPAHRARPCGHAFGSHSSMHVWALVFNEERRPVRRPADRGRCASGATTKHDHINVDVTWLFVCDFHLQLQKV